MQLFDIDQKFSLALGTEHREIFQLGVGPDLGSGSALTGRAMNPPGCIHAEIACLLHRFSSLEVIIPAAVVELSQLIDVIFGFLPGHVVDHDFKNSGVKSAGNHMEKAVCDLPVRIGPAVGHG